MGIILGFKMIPHLLWKCAILAFTLIAILSAQAQDLEPRAYANTPVGMNFILARYEYSEGGVATDPTVPLENAELQAHKFLLAYACSMDVWGLSGKFNMIVPYACASGSAELSGQLRERDICGLADPRLRLAVNIFGAPALTLNEFKNYQQDLIVGVSLQVTPPLGQYDAEKLLNIGTNRWSFEPEIGISKRVGALTLELAASVSYFTDNDDFLGSQTLEQDPIYAVQGHIIYGFKSGIWGALNGTFYTGGRTTIDGVKGDTLQENSRVGATFTLPVNRHHSIKLYASTGVSTRTGSDFDAIGFAWQYRWGGGL